MHSDMPYTSLIWMPSAPKYSSTSTVIGAAPVNAYLHASSPSVCFTCPTVVSVGNDPSSVMGRRCWNTLHVCLHGRVAYAN